MMMTVITTCRNLRFCSVFFFFFFPLKSSLFFSFKKPPVHFQSILTNFYACLPAAFRMEAIAALAYLPRFVPKIWDYMNTLGPKQNMEIFFKAVDNLGKFETSFGTFGFFSSFIHFFFFPIIRVFRRRVLRLCTPDCARDNFAFAHHSWWLRGVPLIWFVLFVYFFNLFVYLFVFVCVWKVSLVSVSQKPLFCFFLFCFVWLSRSTRNATRLVQSSWTMLPGFSTSSYLRLAVFIYGILIVIKIKCILRFPLLYLQLVWESKDGGQARNSECAWKKEWSLCDIFWLLCWLLLILFFKKVQTASVATLHRQHGNCLACCETATKRDHSQR